MTTTIVTETTSRTLITEAGGTTVQESSSSVTQVQSCTPTTLVTSTVATQSLITEPGRAGPPGEDAPPSFESFSKNLRAYPASFGYALDGTLETVAFDTPDGTVTKALGYASGRLTTITLSGAIPSGIDTVKTLVYAGDSLASVSYS